MAVTKVNPSVSSASVGGGPLNLDAVACVQPILRVSGANEQSQVLTLKQAAQYLQISKAHLSNVINRKVAGVPPLRQARAGRRILIKRQWADEWLEVAGQESFR
jgi:excisionase family DNA binding protein